MIIGLLTLAVIAGVSAFAWKAYAVDDNHDTLPTPPADAPPLGVHAAPADQAGKQTDDKRQPGGPMLGAATPPRDLVASTPKGELKDPYNADIAAIAEEGHHRFLSAGCNGCHGGGGGGGMCPPLTNDTWVYGAGDDTLFRLVTLGSDALQKDGYTRVKHEVVVGPMPPFGDIIKTSDDLWRIIAFIRSVNPSSMKQVDTPYAPAQ
ncbi:MAG: c-type cytochrome [Methyloceanibacter sp.]|nr:c-type cytochrome [Methyloceanibacter sp.]